MRPGMALAKRAAGLPGPLTKRRGTACHVCLVQRGWMAGQRESLDGHLWAGDAAVTATHREFSRLRGSRDMNGDTPANGWHRISCESADVGARAGCVWSDDVKDPTRLPSKRYHLRISPLVKGVMKPSGRSPLESSWAHADVAVIHGFERSKPDRAREDQAPFAVPVPALG